ncbi:hypothetical protein [Streptomyces sp. NPDC090025]|uniref:hypothetical protein n=1 Tax=Streptomyces sp. NPDC090025 TaxID=3365922 RepID=UPI0038387425
MLGATTFSPSPTGALPRVADLLAEDHGQGGLRTPTRNLCRAAVRGTLNRVDIGFGLYRESELFGDARPIGLHPYSMGREAHSGPAAAYLFVECASPLLKGSGRRPAPIRGWLRFGQSELPDTPAVREANLTILHSVTLNVVKKLGCENNAGLTEKPVLKPRPETNGEAKQRP